MQGWEGVRSVGELNILARASYSTLVVVPLLVAFWPAVRLAIVGYDDARHATASTLSRNADELQDSVRQAARVLDDLGGSSPALAEELRRIRESLESDAAALSLQSREAANTLRLLPSARTGFPRTFAAAFYAALFISLGHFAYQKHAPEEVKSAKRATYVDTAIDAFYKHPTQLAFDRALISLGVTTFPDLPAIDEGVSWPDAAAARLAPHVEWIRRAADARYSSLANERPGWRSLASICYAVGLVLILVILTEQSVTVFRETFVAPFGAEDVGVSR